LDAIPMDSRASVAINVLCLPKGNDAVTKTMKGGKLHPKYRFVKPHGRCRISSEVQVRIDADHIFVDLVNRRYWI